MSISEASTDSDKTSHNLEDNPHTLEYIQPRANHFAKPQRYNLKMKIECHIRENNPSEMKQLTRAT
jgi:hypothetical protein